MNSSKQQYDEKTKNKLMARELFWIKSEWIQMIRKLNPWSLERDFGLGNKYYKIWLGKNLEMFSIEWVELYCYIKIKFPKCDFYIIFTQEDVFFLSNRRDGFYSFI